jgi:hypothetical protein
MLPLRPAPYAAVQNYLPEAFLHQEGQAGVGGWVSVSSVSEFHLMGALPLFYGKTSRVLGDRGEAPLHNGM